MRALIHIVVRDKCIWCGMSRWEIHETGLECTAPREHVKAGGTSSDHGSEAREAERAG